METRAGGGNLEIRPHWRAFGVWYLAMLLLGTGPLSNPEAVLSPLQALAIALVIGLGIAVKSRTSVLTVTPETITRRGGLIDRRPLALPTSDLARIRIIAGITSRVLGVGSLILEPKGEGPEIKFWGVENPKAVRAEIEKMAGRRVPPEAG